MQVRTYRPVLSLKMTDCQSVCVCVCACVCVRASACMHACVRACLYVCVFSVTVKCPVLPPCAVHGRSRNPLYYYLSRLLRYVSSLVLFCCCFHVWLFILPWYNHPNWLAYRPFMRFFISANEILKLCQLASCYRQFIPLNLSGMEYNGVILCTTGRGWRELFLCRCCLLLVTGFPALTCNLIRRPHTTDHMLLLGGKDVHCFQQSNLFSLAAGGRLSMGQTWGYMPSIGVMDVYATSAIPCNILCLSVCAHNWVQSYVLYSQSSISRVRVFCW